MSKPTKKNCYTVGLTVAHVKSPGCFIYLCAEYESRTTVILGWINCSMQ